MIDFLKSFFSNEKSPEEQALLSGNQPRDVMRVGGYEEPAEEASGCGTQKPASGGGCGGCGCR